MLVFIQYFLSLRILAGFGLEDNSVFDIESYLLKSLEELGTPL